jgi:hypothetical protein
MDLLLTHSLFIFFLYVYSSLLLHIFPSSVLFFILQPAFLPIFILFLKVIVADIPPSPLPLQAANLEYEYCCCFQYKAMLISLSVHLLLLMFELLVADNLGASRHLWILVRAFFFLSQL